MPNITAFRDFNCFRIFINDLLHLDIKMEGYKGFQSWYEGSTNRMFYIEFYFKEGEPIYAAYDDQATWEEILKLVNQKI